MQQNLKNNIKQQLHTTQPAKRCRDRNGWLGLCCFGRFRSSAPMMLSMIAMSPYAVLDCHVAMSSFEVLTDLSQGLELLQKNLDFNASSLGVVPSGIFSGRKSAGMGMLPVADGCKVRLPIRVAELRWGKEALVSETCVVAPKPPSSSSSSSSSPPQSPSPSQSQSSSSSFSDQQLCWIARLRNKSCRKLSLEREIRVI